MSDDFNLNEGREKINKGIPKIHFGFNKKIIAPIIIMLAVPLTVGLALTQTNILKFAGGGPAIAEVRVDPGSVNSSVGGAEHHLSAMAVDAGGNPVNYPVTYEWSMSSMNTVGTLSRTDTHLTDFKPLGVGCGQLTVAARNGDNVVTKSVSVVVSDSQSTPECGSTPTPSAPVSSSYHRIFVTSNAYEGSMGGLSGANSKCMQSAQSANLGGGWKAWLSDSYTNPGSQMTLIDKNLPFKLLNGTTVANDWVDLTDGSIQAPINVTEFNQTRTSYRGLVWTNTNPDGTSVNPSNSCRNWSSYSDRDFGGVGNFNNTDANWSNTRTGDCSSLLPLYCVEQGVFSDPNPTVAPTTKPTNTPPTPTFTPVPTSAPLKMTINAAADAFVRSTAPNQNFGTTTSLELDTNPNEISYLRFNLLNLAGKTIVSAKLRLKVSDASKKILTLRRGKVVEWSETGITFNNRVGFDATIRNFNATAVNSVVELDVKNAVNLRKGGKINFGITSGGDDTAAFYSRESGSSNKPLLIVEYR